MFGSIVIVIRVQIHTRRVIRHKNVGESLPKLFRHAAINGEINGITGDDEKVRHQDQFIGDFVVKDLGNRV